MNNGPRNPDIPKAKKLKLYILEDNLIRNKERKNYLSPNTLDTNAGIKAKFPACRAPQTGI